jgi:hypothetical protein
VVRLIGNESVRRPDLFWSESASIGLSREEARVSISEWTIAQVENLIANYDRAGKTEGGPFTRTQAVLELERRRGVDFNGRKAAIFILSSYKEHPDRWVTYGEIWVHYFPGEPWVGNYSAKIVGKVLHAAAYYCASNGLPIVTALVSRANLTVTLRAMQNMYDAASDWGLDVGQGPEEFYQTNIERLKSLQVEYLP